METKGKTVTIIAVLALLIASITGGIAFAALSTTLQINGSAALNPVTWNIKFDTLSAAALTGGATVTTAPTITGNTTLGTFAVSLTKPGDSVTYTINITNSGTADAKISTFTKAATPTCTGTGATAAADATLVCGIVKYTLTYTSGGAAVAANDTLTAGQTRGVTLKIEYPLTATQVPTAKVDITNLGITLLYSQA